MSDNMISAEELLKVSERRGKKTAIELGYSKIKSITNYYSKEQVINILNKTLERFDEMKNLCVTNQGTWNECIACCSRIIQQKIDKLKGNEK